MHINALFLEKIENHLPHSLMVPSYCGYSYSMSSNKHEMCLVALTHVTEFEERAKKIVCFKRELLVSHTPEFAVSLKLWMPLSSLITYMCVEAS